jgi:hypothetical protein
MLYQVLGLLKANGGPWGAERQGEFSPIWENCYGGTDLPTKDSVLSHFLANQVHSIHEEHILDVVPNTGVAGTSHWPVG